MVEKMYLPEIFEEKNTEKLYQLVEKYPLGTLVTHSTNGIEANHLPFKLLHEPKSNHAILIAHIARNNELHTLIGSGTDVLVIFQGEQGYISPNWYPSKQLHHRHVPTWNYQVVHVKGKITFLEDEKSLRGILAKLTRTHEAKQEKPWKMSDAPSDYIAAELKEIIGIEIEIQHMIGKFKLSQNRDQSDAVNVVNNLEKQGQIQLAEAVKQYIED